MCNQEKERLFLNRKEERETYLLSILNSAGRISTAEAVKLLDVSEATARRMFSEMEREGKIVRNYGGIQKSDYSKEYSFASHEKVCQQEKARIGRLAATFVADGDTIYLDCGTTVFQMTLALNARILHGEFQTLNIITNSIANIQALPKQDGCRVILVGGEYNCERRDFSGPLTEKNLAPFHFTKAFLGCDGLVVDMGFSSNQLSISSLNDVVMERTKKTFVLLDQSKFGRNSLISYAEMREVQDIITDAEPPAELLQKLQQEGVQVHIAESGKENDAACTN
jgi:DeoR family fructose operon transcriptional repressor